MDEMTSAGLMQMGPFVSMLLTELVNWIMHHYAHTQRAMPADLMQQLLDILRQAAESVVTLLLNWLMHK